MRRLLLAIPLLCFTRPVHAQDAPVRAPASAPMVVAAPNPVFDIAPGRPLIVFLHGRNQPFKTSRELELEWIGGFEDGMEKVDLDRAVRAGDRVMVRYEDIYEGDARPEDLCSAGDVSAYYATRKPLSPRVRRHHVRFNTETLRRWGAKYLHLSGLALDHFLFDTRDYFTRPEMRCTTNRRLLDVLRQAKAGQRPVIVVAHSMGGLVAYDALLDFAAADSFDVRRVVTVGTQIGLDPAMKGLRPGQLSQSTESPIPAAFRSWVNIRDHKDKLGFEARRYLDPSDSTRLPREIRVYNLPGDPHNVTGYLQNRRTARAIAYAWCNAFPVRGEPNHGLSDRPAQCDEVQDVHNGEEQPYTRQSGGQGGGGGALKALLYGAAAGALAGYIVAN